MLKKILVFLMLINCAYIGMHQTKLLADNKINPELLKHKWPAVWVTHPDGPFRDYGVFHFRKSFTINRIPGSFLIHISADNRYQLFVNGIKVSLGPARSDLNHWRFETVDLAPYLKTGKNILAVVVWNFGVDSPIWQHSSRTGLIVQGDGIAEQIVNTGTGWKCIRNDAYKPIPIRWDIIPFFCVVGPGEDIDASKYPWGWEKPEFDDSDWQQTITIEPGQPMELFQWNVTPWMLQPRDIPQMEETPQRLEKIVRNTNTNITNDFLKGHAPFTIPPNTKALILLDRGQLTTAYPELIVDSGEGSEIKITYAEALWKPDWKSDRKDDWKGNRNETEGKEMLGYFDIFRPDGKERMFRTLYWRTYRYLQMEIETGSNPLIIKDLRGVFTAYPFTQEASFECSDPGIAKIWDIGWHTFRLCANETYFDCPYYEQLNYTGDDRVIAMVNMTNASDYRLVKNAILQFYYSAQPEGLMQDRYPSTEPQYIPTYSLDWICLLHDLWFYRGEEDFIKPLVPASRPILSWFEERLNKSGVLRNVSWRDPNYEGPMPANWNRPTARLTLEYILALKDAAELENAFGTQYHADRYLKLLSNLRRNAYNSFWVSDIGLLSETQEHKKFSQHVNVLGVLADVIPKEDWKAVLQRTIDGSVKLIREKQSQSSYYWLHYLHKAMTKAGMGNDYIKMLKPWYDMIEMGFTTWAEAFPPTRSDCHAWSSSPNVNLLTIVCGIKPAVPGFKKVIIEPNLCELKWAKGKMTHPGGFITVDLKRTGQTGLNAEVSLPEGITGWFIWNNKKVTLRGGKQNLTF